MTCYTVWCVTWHSTGQCVLRYYIHFFMTQPPNYMEGVPQSFCPVNTPMKSIDNKYKFHPDADCTDILNLEAKVSGTSFTHTTSGSP